MNDYDKSAWEQETSLGRRLFIYNFAMTGNELAGWQMIKTVVSEKGAGAVEKTYLFKRKKSDKEELVQVVVVESNYWRHAQQHLLENLQHCMRPNIPQGKGKAKNIGDVQFAAQTQDAKQVGALFFARGNLQITVRSVGSQPVDVAGLAKKIDSCFTAPPSKTDKDKQRVKSIQPKTVKAKAAEQVPLIEQLPEPILRSGWTRVLVPEGEVRREGDVLYFVSEKEGAKSVEILNFKTE